MKSDKVTKRETQKDIEDITSMLAKSVAGPQWVLHSQPAELSNMSASSCDTGQFFWEGHHNYHYQRAPYYVKCGTMWEEQR